MPHIREAKTKDIPRILSLYQQLTLCGAAESPKNCKKYVPILQRIKRDTAQRLFVVEEKGEVIGTYVFILLHSLYDFGSPWAEIEYIVVDECYRGKGYGKRMMAHAEKLAQKAGCFELQFSSDARRTEAHKFYESLGYKSTADRKSVV